MSASSSTPRLDIGNLLGSRATTRVGSWEIDFEKNHKSFAEEIAQSVVQNTLETLRKTLSDPYSKAANSLTTYISLDITDSLSAKQIRDLAKSKGELPPFKDWLTKFAPAANPSGQDPLSQKTEDVDVAYFQDMMAIVSRVAAEKTQKLLNESAGSSPQPANFQFTVTGHRKSGPIITKPTDFSENRLRIDFSLKGKVATLSRIDPNRIPAITQHRAEKGKEDLRQLGHVWVLALFTMAVITYICQNFLTDSTSKSR